MDLQQRMEHAVTEVPATVKAVVRTLVERGHEAVVVGGAVRDLVMGLHPGDFDVATSATPDAVIQTFPHTVPTGIKHGTVTVVQVDDTGHHVPVEVTTFRTETGYLDGRRPERVSFVAELKEDLSRRDFTVNAMALHLYPAPRLEDPFGGWDDLRGRILRTVGSADGRFGEDGLRAVRAARFAAQLELTPADGLEDAMRRALPVVRKVAHERFLQELRKLMEKSTRPSVGLAMLARTGLMELMAPKAPRDDASLLRPDRVARYEEEARFAAWLWDGGKQAALATMTGLKASKQLSDDTAALCTLPRPDVIGGRSGAELRRLVRTVGRRRLQVVEALFASEGGNDVMQQIRATLDAGYVESPSELALDGHAVTAATGVKGPQLGALLRALVEHVDEDPSANTRERLLAFAQRWLSTQGS